MPLFSLELRHFRRPGLDGFDRQRIEALVRQKVGEVLAAPASVGTPAREAPRLVVNISARHAHLNRRALSILFGEGSELTVQKPLYQEGAFSAEQVLSSFGPRRQMISNLRVLGPLRDECQVELAFTDARFLGIDAPVRVSGDHRDTPGCYLVGPAGGLELTSGVIRAARHVHMHPREAGHYGVDAGDRLDLIVESEQGGRLEGLICRVSEKEKLEVHLDTDEGNALDLVHARKAYLTE